MFKNKDQMILLKSISWVFADKIGEIFHLEIYAMEKGRDEILVGGGTLYNFVDHFHTGFHFSISGRDKEGTGTQIDSPNPIFRHKFEKIIIIHHTTFEDVIKGRNWQVHC